MRFMPSDKINMYQTADLHLRAVKKVCTGTQWKGRGSENSGKYSYTYLAYRQLPFFAYRGHGEG
jgi:hypothetical protein